MCSLFLVVCMSTYDKIKSCNQQIHLSHLLYLNTDLKGYLQFRILVRIHGIRQHQTNQQGWTSLPNRKRPEVLLWLSLMGSFQIVDVASASVHHDMVSKATILACGNRTSPWKKTNYLEDLLYFTGR